MTAFYSNKINAISILNTIHTVKVLVLVLGY